MELRVSGLLSPALSSKGGEGGVATLVVEAKFLQPIRLLGAEAEDVVHLEDDGAGLAFGELAVWVFEFEEGGAGAGTSVTVRLELDGFSAGAGEGVDEPGEGDAIAAEFLIEGARPQVAKGVENMEGGELEGGVVDLGGIKVANKVRGGFLPGPNASDEGLLGQPILVSAFFPVREVRGAEALALVSQGRSDLGVGCAVLEH